MSLIAACTAAAAFTDRVLRSVNNFIIYVSTAVLLSALTINVVMRYVFEEGGAAWLSEVPEHVFPWMVAAGVVLAALQGAHIAVDLLLDKLSPRTAKALALFIQVIVGATYATLAVIAVNVSNIVSIEYSSLLRISRSWDYYAMVYMSLGMVLASLILVIRVLRLGREAVANTEGVTL